MNNTTRAFLAVGLVALSVAALLHLLITVGFVGMWTALVHLTLFGWISAMIFGVNYHTLPVFSGRRFPYPRLTQNDCVAFSLGLGLMTAGLITSQNTLVVVGLIVECVAALLFVANMLLLFTQGVKQGAGIHRRL